MSLQYLDVLTADECEQVRQWRHGVMASLRTPRLLSAEQQQAFYRDQVLNPTSAHRYYAVRQRAVEGHEDPGLLAMAGLTCISWENRTGEISLIVNPRWVRHGIGREAVRLILVEGFNRLGLEVIFGECYHCNPGFGFWTTLAAHWSAQTATLPGRKFWAGRRWDSFYFSWDRAVLEAHLGGPHVEG